MGYGENNLFNPELSTGDLRKIRPVVRFVQMISVWTISIIGLAITISTIIKQAVHGLYVTNPKLWDKVDEVHKQKLGATVDKGGNQIQILLGFGLSFIFSLLPNIKSITEFDGDVIDPKTFFTTSLPKSVVYLFIGSFIFYGYTTKIGEKVTMFGNEVIDNFFLQIDPIEWAAKIPTTFAKVNLSTSGSKADFDEEVNKVTKKAYSVLKSNLDDITKEKQPRVALNVEKWVIGNMESVRQYTDTSSWKISYSARTTPGESDLSKINNGHNSDNTEFTFAWQKPLNEFDTGSASPNVNSDYLRVDVTFTKKAEKDHTQSVRAIMHGGKYASGTKEATIELGTASSDAQLTGNTIEFGIDGKAGTAMINGSKLTLKMKDKKDSLPNNLKELKDITGLYYSYGSKSHPIVSIVVDGGQDTSIYFVPESSKSSVEKWNWGSGPSNKSSSGANTTKSDNDSDTDNEDATVSNNENNPNDVIN